MSHKSTGNFADTVLFSDLKPSQGSAALSVAVLPAESDENVRDLSDYRKLQLKTGEIPAIGLEKQLDLSDCSLGFRT